MLFRTPSKINLFLRVTGKLPGGFHSIETLFLPLTQPADELEVDFIADGKKNIILESDHPAVPCDERNLCWKASTLVMNALKITDSLRIRLRKKIPVAGGMGGGSSDAGAMIRILQERYGNLPDLGAAIALECGSDVPFFLNPEPSVGRGRGEILSPAKGLRLPEIRIIPMDFPISAKWAYQHLSPEINSDSRSLDDMLIALQKGDFESVAYLLRNDLAPAVFRKFPVLEWTKRKFEEENPGWKVQLSGSGATLFAIRYK